MLNTFTVLLVSITGFLFSSPELLAQNAKAQQTIAQQIQRLQHRYEIEDIDGIGELIEPLFAEVVTDANSDMNLPQKHLIAVAAVKFYSSTGDHSHAIVPYLVAQRLHSELKRESRIPLVEPVDRVFQESNLPPVFFSEEARTRFRAQLKAAIENGACPETELSNKFYSAQPDQLSKVQKQMFDAVSAVKSNPQPRDRAILRLIDHYISHRDQHSTLAQECLATAIEALNRLQRDAEADRLTSVFRTQFPDSRRLNR